MDVVASRLALDGPVGLSPMDGLAFAVAEAEAVLSGGYADYLMAIDEEHDALGRLLAAAKDVLKEGS